MTTTTGSVAVLGTKVGAHSGYFLKYLANGWRERSAGLKLRIVLPAHLSESLPDSHAHLCCLAGKGALALHPVAIPPDFEPSDLGTVYHRGRTTRKLDWLDSIWSKRILARTPGRLGRRNRFWLEIRNSDARMDRAVHVPEAPYERLVAPFSPAVASLEALIGLTVPWGRLRGGCAP